MDAAILKDVLYWLFEEAPGTGSSARLARIVVSLADGKLDCAKALNHGFDAERAGWATALIQAVEADEWAPNGMLVVALSAAYETA